MASFKDTLCCTIFTIIAMIVVTGAGAGAGYFLHRYARNFEAQAKDKTLNDVMAPYKTRISTWTESYLPSFQQMRLAVNKNNERNIIELKGHTFIAGVEGDLVMDSRLNMNYTTHIKNVSSFLVHRGGEIELNETHPIYLNLSLYHLTNRSATLLDSQQISIYEYFGKTLYNLKEICLVVDTVAMKLGYADPTKRNHGCYFGQSPFTGQFRAGLHVPFNQSINSTIPERNETGGNSTNSFKVDPLLIPITVRSQEDPYVALQRLTKGKLAVSPIGDEKLLERATEFKKIIAYVGIGCIILDVLLLIGCFLCCCRGDRDQQRRKQRKKLDKKLAKRIQRLELEDL